MSAGQPNWQKLFEMGKLPKLARGKVPILAQLDAVEKRIEEIKKGVCDNCREKLFEVEPEIKSGDAEIKCEVDGCEYIASGRTEAIAKNNLRLHGRTHAVKE